MVLDVGRSGLHSQVSAGLVSTCLKKELIFEGAFEEGYPIARFVRAQHPTTACQRTGTPSPDPQPTSKLTSSTPEDATEGPDDPA